MEPKVKEQAPSPEISEIMVMQDDILRPEVTSLINIHFAASNKTNIKISRLLDLSALQQSNITIFTARNASNDLMGCTALKQISPTCGEIKSMRTAAGHQRKGVAGALIKHILEVAKVRGYTVVRLETGVSEVYAPARALYKKFGFTASGPFEGYEDAVEISVFMTYHIH
jgi:predicted GNAT family acetyltransferase